MNDEFETYEYHLTVLSIRMKVKFSWSFLTAEVPQTTNNKFIFNQQLKINRQENVKDCYEFTLHLITDRGARYIGGVVRLYHSQMISSQGEKLTLSVLRCIDGEAFCQIRVDEVLNNIQRKINYDGLTYVHKNRVKDNQYIKNSLYNNSHLQSKTDYQYPQNNSRNKHRIDSQSKKSPYVSPSSNSRVNYVKKNNQHTIRHGQYQFSSPAQKHEAQLYKQQYKKIKQKYKKQEELTKAEQIKSFNLQNHQNVLKMEVLKYKMKAQQLEKTLNSRNLLQKDNQNSNFTVKQLQREFNALKQQISMKQNIIIQYESIVQMLNKKNQQISKNNQTKNYEQNYKYRQLKTQLQNLQKIMKKNQRQQESQLKYLKMIYNQKDVELSMKAEQLQKARKIIEQYQKQINEKNYEIKNISDYQKQIMKGKTKTQQLKTKMQALQYQLSEKNNENRQLQKQNQEIKSKNFKNQYEFKMLNQELQFIKIENNENKKIKDKYTQLNFQHKSLLQQYQRLEKYAERILNNKQQNQHTINTHFQEQMDHYKELYQEILQTQKESKGQHEKIKQQLIRKNEEIQKLKKNIENTSRQVLQIKSKQKNAKNALKTKQQQTMGLQTQHEALKKKVKIIDDIYQSQLNKIIFQNDNNKNKLSQQLKRNELLSIKLHDLAEEFNKTRSRLQIFQNGLKNAQSQVKVKNNQIQNMIKEYQQTLSSIEMSLFNCKKSQKQLSNKNQQLQLDIIRNEQRFQKSKKQSRVWQQKYNLYSIQLKSKHNQNQNLIQSNQGHEQKIQELSNEKKQLQERLNQFDNDKNILSKSVESLTNELNEAKVSLNSLILELKEKNLTESDKSKELRLLRESKSKLEIVNNLMKKQNQSNKQTLHENIKKYLIPLFSINISKLKLQESSNINLNIISLDELINLISIYGKQLKLILTKMQDNTKNLQKQKQNLAHQNVLQSQKYNSIINNLKQKILKQEHAHISFDNQKQSQINNLLCIIEQLKEKEKQNQQSIQDLNHQIQELHFNSNNIKIDYETLNDQNTKRMNNLRKNNTEISQKLQQALNQIVNIEEINQILQKKILSTQQQILLHVQKMDKKDKHLKQFTLKLNKKQQQVETLKHNKKQLNDRIIQLQLFLTNQKQIGEELKAQINNTDSKNKQLNQFIHNLMKQKQRIIQKDIQNGQNYNQIQFLLRESQKRCEDLDLEKNKNQRIIQNFKEEVIKKKMAMRQLEESLKAQTIKSHKLSQSLHIKQDQLKQHIQKFHIGSQSMGKLNEQKRRQIHLLQEQISSANACNISNIKQFNQKILILQNENQRNKNTIHSLDDKLNQNEQEIFIKNERCFKLEEVIQKYQTENLQLINKINMMDINVNQIADQLREKQQKLFQLSGKNYKLQKQIEFKTIQAKQLIQNLNIEWQQKLQSFYQEYQLRLQKEEQQKSYLRHMITQTQSEISKLIDNKRKSQENENNLRKTYEQKIRKSQEQKLHNLSLKNQELHKISQQSKRHVDSLGEKDNQVKKIQHQLQISRRLNNSLEIKWKQFEQKYKNIEKLSQVEIDQLKKKEQNHKFFKENLYNQQWNTEREIKKILQGFIRNYIDNYDKGAQSVIQNLQTNLIAAINFKVHQK